MIIGSLSSCPWLLLVATARIVAPVAMVVLIFYIMWTGQDIKNIHVAAVVICVVYSTDKPAEPKPDKLAKFKGGP